MADRPLGQNIARLRAHLDLKQDAFADRVGTNQGNISKWEKRGITPGSAPLAIMAGLAGVSAAAFISEPWHPPTRALPAEQQPTRSADLGEAVPITSLDLSLSMGPGTLIEEFVEDEPVMLDLALVRTITRTPSDRLRMVRGIGHSMEPTLRTDDRVLIDINERAMTRVGGVYWIDYHGAHGIKRLRPAGKGKILVMSDNTVEPDFEVAANELRIEGRAIWFARGL